VVRIRATGHRTGIFRALSLKGLQISYNNIDSKDILPASGPHSPSIAYLSFSKKDAENLVFTRFHSGNDSITIITYHPKNYFSGDSEISWMTGQVIIDTKAWRILRIDGSLDNISREYQNYLAKTSSNGKKIVHEANQSVFFSANGLPSKVEEKAVYSLKNRPEEIYTWTCVQVYKDISKAEYQQKPSGLYKPKKFLFQQKPVTISDFDAQYNHGFQ
jgi:hypothetical protein